MSIFSRKIDNLAKMPKYFFAVNVLCILLAVSGKAFPSSCSLLKLKCPNCFIRIKILSAGQDVFGKECDKMKALNWKHTLYIYVKISHVVEKLPHTQICYV